MKDRLDQDQSSYHVESTESPQSEFRFQLVKERLPGGIFNSRRCEWRSKIFRRQMGDGESQNSGYISLCGERGIEKEKLRLGGIDRGT